MTQYAAIKSRFRINFTQMKEAELFMENQQSSEASPKRSPKTSPKLSPKLSPKTSTESGSNPTTPTTPTRTRSTTSSITPRSSTPTRRYSIGSTTATNGGKKPSTNPISPTTTFSTATTTTIFSTTTFSTTPINSTITTSMKPELISPKVSKKFTHSAPISTTITARPKVQTTNSAPIISVQDIDEEELQISPKNKKKWEPYKSTVLKRGKKADSFPKTNKESKSLRSFLSRSDSVEKFKLKLLPDPEPVIEVKDRNLMIEYNVGETPSWFRRAGRAMQKQHKNLRLFSRLSGVDNKQLRSELIRDISDEIFDHKFGRYYIGPTTGTEIIIKQLNTVLRIECCRFAIEIFNIIGHVNFVEIVSGKLAITTEIIGYLNDLMVDNDNIIRMILDKRHGEKIDVIDWTGQIIDKAFAIKLEQINDTFYLQSSWEIDSVNNRILPKCLDGESSELPIMPIYSWYNTLH